MPRSIPSNTSKLDIPIPSQLTAVLADSGSLYGTSENVTQILALSSPAGVQARSKFAEPRNPDKALLATIKNPDLSREQKLNKAIAHIEDGASPIYVDPDSEPGTCEKPTLYIKETRHEKYKQTCAEEERPILDVAMKRSRRSKKQNN